MNHWKDRRAAFSAILFGVTLLCLCSEAGATSVRDASTGITVDVGLNGTYSISTDSPQWTLGGAVGNPIGNIQAGSGADGLGAYQQLSFGYFDGASRQASIKLYNVRPVFLFAVTYTTFAPNSNPFQIFTTYPSALGHLTYDGQFASHSLNEWGATSPWAFFDSAGNAFVISPASDFMVAQTSL